MVPGDVYDRTFSTSAGDIGVLAEVDVEGSTLILKDLAIFPTSAATLRVGARTMIEIRDHVAREAATLGFAALRLTGTRATGALPGKQVDLTVDLERYR